ncbi:phenylalanine ammonia-lyase, partial [Metarhizium brunneum ARSEF 3297]
MSVYLNSHFELASRLFEDTEAYKPGQKVIITGQDLEVSTVVAVSRGRCQPQLTKDETTSRRIRASVSRLAEYLGSGNTVYGVTTGFGGSADSRTTETGKLQLALLQLTQNGVLRESDKTADNANGNFEHHTEISCYPTAWVRASMFVRCNATARGHSAVTLEVLQAILRLLRHDVVPIIPLRGTVSASGDLMPLSYIAGAIEGNPDVVVRTTLGTKSIIQSASEALERENIQKIIFGPKEAVGLVNGTAPSAAVAALVMYEAHHLATLTQAITAMTVDAMTANAESFHPFIALVRPHAGQIEASKNILAFLQDSSFAKGIKTVKESNPSGLAQDRYALRSSPQWIGPQLEDLLSAHKQITTELNSSADNPLVDGDSGDVYYGANFQAAAVTSAMEKTRIALQMLGRLLFAQSTELIDPNLNGLPANLAADDPSTSFTMKGVDISMAAYASELCYLANPVSSHVHTAEMHNQSINSLAFLSARMTKKAAELLSLMAATCLYIVCQAMDLRAFQSEFLSELQVAIDTLSKEVLAEHIEQPDLLELNLALRRCIESSWKDASRLDVPDRAKAVGDATTLELIKAITLNQSSSSKFASLCIIESWRHEVENITMRVYGIVKRKFFACPTTEKYIGIGPRALYMKIRHDLGVPFHQGLVEHPVSQGKDERIQGKTARPRKTIGSWVSIIYEALLEGKIYDAIYRCLPREAENAASNVSITNADHTTDCCRNTEKMRAGRSIS